MKYVSVLTLCCCFILPYSLFAQINQLQRDSIYSVLSSYSGNEKLNKYNEIYNNHIYPSEDSEFAIIYLNDFLKEAQKKNDVKILSNVHYLLAKRLKNDGDFLKLKTKLPEFLLFAEKHKNRDIFAALSDLKLNITFFQDENIQQALEEALELKKAGEEQKEPLMQIITLKYLGLISERNDQEPEAESYFREALNLAQKVSDKKSIHDLYDRLSRHLIGAMRDEEALAVAQEQAKLLEATPEDHYYRYYCFLRHVSALTYLNRLDEAKKYLDKAEYELQFCAPAARKEFIFFYLRYLRTKGDLDEALSLIHKERKNLEDRGLLNTPSTLYLLNNEIEILQDKEEYYDAFKKHTEYTRLNDSIRSKELAEQINKLRVQFEVDKLTFEKERNRNYLLLALLICGLLIALLIFSLISSRKLTTKNKSLVQQIKEEDLLAKRLDEKEEEVIGLKKLLKTSNNIQEESQEEDDLYFRTKELMKDKTLYTNRDLKRKDLARLLGTNERSLANMLHKYTNLTINDYITQKRLEYARELLLDAKNYTLETVAFESGIGERTSLYRLFKKHYGISPDEFRKLAN